jgi:hypothetical protein
MNVSLGRRARSPLGRCCLALFVLALVSSAYFVQGVGMNQNSRFDLLRAIVEGHTLSIDAYEGNTMDKSARDGHFYSDKAPGLSFASVPVEELRDAAGWPGDDRPALAIHVLTVAVIGLSSAVAAVLLFLTLLRMGIARLAAALAVTGWLVGTHAFGYATLYYAHQFAAALLVASFCLIHACKDAPSSSGARWRLAMAGALAGWAAISEYPAAIAAAMIFVYGVVALGAAEPPLVALRRIVPFVLAALPPIALLMAYDARCFGGPFRLGYGSLANDFHDTMATGFGLTGPKLHVLGEILWSEWRGLFWLSPFLVLAFPGAALLARRAGTRLEAWLAVGISVFFLLFNASYEVWYGGASMGPRHVVPMLPFTVLLCAGTLDALGRVRAPLGTMARVVACALLVTSVAVCTMTVAVMPELLEQRHIRSPGPGVDPPDMRYPLRTFVFPSFRRGYLGVKGTLPNGQMGIASTAPGHDWDAYNLGEALGLHGLASLAPLFAAWACLAFMLFGAAVEASPGAD